jgi:hypothetical protein
MAHGSQRPGAVAISNVASTLLQESFRAGSRATRRTPKARSARESPRSEALRIPLCSRECDRPKSEVLTPDRARARRCSFVELVGDGQQGHEFRYSSAAEGVPVAQFSRTTTGSIRTSSTSLRSSSFSQIACAAWRGSYAHQRSRWRTKSITRPALGSPGLRCSLRSSHAARVGVFTPVSVATTAAIGKLRAAAQTLEGARISL